MTEFVFGPYRLEVDVEATRDWYDHLRTMPPAAVDCAYCRNYAAAVGGSCRRRWRRFWNPWGWISTSPAMTGGVRSRSQGGRWYMPLWHIAGRLLEAGEGELPIAPGVTAGFVSGYGALFPENFPEPCLPVLDSP